MAKTNNNETKPADECSRKTRKDINPTSRQTKTQNNTMRQMLFGELMITAPESEI